MGLQCVRRDEQATMTRAIFPANPLSLRADGIQAPAEQMPKTIDLPLHATSPYRRQGKPTRCRFEAGL